MLSVIKHAGKQARKRASQQARKQGQSLKKSEPCPLGACCFWNSRERAQERGLKEEGSRKRAQEGGAMPWRGLFILGNASF